MLARFRADGRAAVPHRASAWITTQARNVAPPPVARPSATTAA